MGLFNKKSTALAMLGSIEIVDAVIDGSFFEPYNIELVRKDFATVDELLQGIKEHKRVQYIFISDAALIGLENGKYEIVKQIRQHYQDVTIAMFFNDERPDEIYKNWAYGYKVYNLYYPDDDGDYDFSKIAEELAEGKSIQNTNENAAEMENRQREIQKREKELEEKETELRDLECRLADAQSLEPTEENNEKIDFLKEEIKKMQETKSQIFRDFENLKKEHEREKKELAKKVEAEKKAYFEKVDAEAKAQIAEIKNKLQSEASNKNVTKTLGCISIGVFSISPGAGSTYTAIQIGEQLAGMGYPTAVIAMDGKSELRFSNGSYADYIVPKDKKVELLEVINRGYNFIIEDFGTLFPIDPSGKIQIGKAKATERKEDIEEFIRCAYKIGVGYSEPWHIGKLNFFIDNDMLDAMTTIYAVKGASDSKEILKCPLPVYDRESDLILSILLNNLGMTRRMEEGRKEKRKGWLGK